MLARLWRPNYWHLSVPRHRMFENCTSVLLVYWTALPRLGLKTCKAPCRHSVIRCCSSEPALQHAKCDRDTRTWTAHTRRIRLRTETNTKGTKTVSLRGDYGIWSVKTIPRTTLRIRYIKHL